MNTLSKEFELIETFIHNYVDAFILVDISEKKVVYVNSKFEKIWGKSLSGFQNDPKSLLHSIHRDDIDEIQRRHSLKPARQLKGSEEFRIVMDDGSIKRICAKVQFVENDQGKVIKMAGFIEDITKRKQFERGLVSLNERMDTVLHILAHDLSGPLALIKTLASVLEKDFDKNAYQEIKKYAQLIQDSSQKSLNLIDDLMQLVSTESENIEINKERVNLVEKLCNILETYKAANKNKQLDFNFNCKSDVLYASVDEIKIMLAVNNLISNAVKFTKQGSISVSIESINNDALIKIKDTGIGIPEKYHHILFDTFTKAGRKGVRGENTTGLGMSIVKRMIDLHDGKIWFESKEGDGTVFNIRIPRE